MKTQSWFCLIVYSILLAKSVVRSEYTWNGSEWVWTESESQSPSVPIEQDEGSGDYTYEDEEGDGWDDTEGSGYDSGYNVPVSKNNNKNKNRDNSRGGGGQDVNQINPNNNFNYQDPNIYDNNPVYPNGNEPVNSWNNPYDTFQPTTKAPWEFEQNKDIYVDPPVQVPTTGSPVDLNPPNNNNYDPSVNMSPKNSNRSTSFFAQPGTLAAVIGGAVVGLLCAILCVMFVVYRMRKKDEGSYALDEPKRSPTVNAYAKHPSREFYA